MDSGFKHFSHAHSLAMHQAHEGAKMACTGCHSLVIGTMFVCQQCNFVLHEQCFRATRSLKHPSHPSHPLTLVPYPTYPSNSFYCNFCKLTGTGLSYSCSDCEFDLHVHCAYSNINQPSIITPVNHHPQTQHNSVQHSYMNAQHVGLVSGQTGNHNPNVNPQYSFMAPNAQVKEYGICTDADVEHARMNMQRIEIENEKSRISAINRQRILDMI